MNSQCQWLEPRLHLEAFESPGPAVPSPRPFLSVALAEFPVSGSMCCKASKLGRSRPSLRGKYMTMYILYNFNYNCNLTYPIQVLNKIHHRVTGHIE